MRLRYIDDFHTQNKKGEADATADCHENEPESIAVFCWMMMKKYNLLRKCCLIFCHGRLSTPPSFPLQSLSPQMKFLCVMPGLQDFTSTSLWSFIDSYPAEQQQHNNLRSRSTVTVRGHTSLCVACVCLYLFTCNAVNKYRPCVYICVRACMHLYMYDTFMCV